MKVRIRQAGGEKQVGIELKRGQNIMTEGKITLTWFSAYPEGEIVMTILEDFEVEQGLHWTAIKNVEKGVIK